MRTLWVFQLFEPLSAAQEEKARHFLDDFLSQWKAHGTPVPAAYEIRYNRFVLIQAQEDAASGCSVDKMFREVLGMLQTQGAKVAGPENVFFKNTDGGFGFIHFKDAENALREGKLNPETIILNAALSLAEELDNFETPLKHSWLSRFMAQGN